MGLKIQASTKPILKEIPIALNAAEHELLLGRKTGYSES
jgi:hypothetical protein